MYYWLEMLTLVLLNIVVFTMVLTRIPRVARHRGGFAGSRHVEQVIDAIQAERRREAVRAGRHRLPA